VFARVVAALRAGRQLDQAMIHEVGYLMRTTAVYGNGKFGSANRATFDTRPGLEGPFAAEMLTISLIRHFTPHWSSLWGRGNSIPKPIGIWDRQFDGAGDGTVSGEPSGAAEQQHACAGGRLSGRWRSSD
jgi:hypothetical protein